MKSKQNDDPHPPTVRFTNVQDLFNVIDCTTRDFLTVTHKKRRRKFRFRRFDHILLEKWEEGISHPQGAMTRKRAAAMLQQNGVLEPMKRQSITSTRNETTNPVSYNVTRGY
ncbi:hypothetical protein B0T25DRAFT_116559 [Lasiosphaeria hispida]|uniref:Uncharacterized protein n=1 Tax=Lasiosphaeria hispida TaxID=260671 RepID=A0AAJ0HR83_9PEZI|nr:hypothetical protein B0T25DRAFT_116559 [Lasiosphaeria hispida]